MPVFLIGKKCVYRTNIGSKSFNVPKLNSWHPKTRLFRKFKACSSVHNKVVYRQTGCAVLIKKLVNGGLFHFYCMCNIYHQFTSSVCVWSSLTCHVPPVLLVLTSTQ